jgi:hypothetical protein
MTVSTSGSPQPSSPLARASFFVGGVLALAVGAIITLGAAIAGALSIAVAAYLYGRKGRRLTRRGAWFSSVAGTVGVLAILIGLAILGAEENQRPMTAAERAEQRAQAQAMMPEWMKAMSPGADRKRATADSMANELLENRAVVVWAGVMAAVLSATLIGTIAGSFAWGGVMLLYRGVKGDWMASSADPTSTPA